MLRNVQGIHAPLRLLAERKAASKVGHLPFLPRSNLMLEVLDGRDELLTPNDIFDGIFSGFLCFIFNLDFIYHKLRSKRIQRSTTASSHDNGTPIWIFVEAYIVSENAPI